jgi:hypothetical protein
MCRNRPRLRRPPDQILSAQSSAWPGLEGTTSTQIEEDPHRVKQSRIRYNATSAKRPALGQPIMCSTGSISRCGFSHVAQAVMSWPNRTETDRQAGARLAETIERIRWRLWHGKVRRALDLIAETAVTMDATADHMEPMTAAGRKVARILADLEELIFAAATNGIAFSRLPSTQRSSPTLAATPAGSVPSSDRTGVRAASRSAVASTGRRQSAGGSRFRARPGSAPFGRPSPSPT